MTIEDEWEQAWNKLKFHRNALALSIKDGRPANDPLRREQVKSLKMAVEEYDRKIDLGMGNITSP